MKPTRFFSLLLVLIAGVFIVTFNSCSKDTTPPTVPTVPTVPSLIASFAFEITDTSAKVGGVVTDDGGASVTERGVCYNTSSNPTITDNSIQSGSGTGTFDCTLTGLDQLTQYFYKAYAINSVGVGYSEPGSVYIPGPCPGMPTINYYGQVYNTAQIGNQCWLKENLNTTKYRDGSAIPNVTEHDEWKYLTTGAYCNHNNDTNISLTYGRLYNWYTVVTRYLCPSGWHVPGSPEWKALTDYLGGEYVAGGKLREIGTTHWHIPNTGATNESGFTALPGSYRSPHGAFGPIGGSGGWWSRTMSGDPQAMVQGVYNNTNWASYHIQDKKSGWSVRCLRIKD